MEPIIEAPLNTEPLIIPDPAAVPRAPILRLPPIPASILAQKEPEPVSSPAPVLNGQLHCSYVTKGGKPCYNRRVVDNTTMRCKAHLTTGLDNKVVPAVTGKVQLNFEKTKVPVHKPKPKVEVVEEEKEPAELTGDPFEDLENMGHVGRTERLEAEHLEFENKKLASLVKNKELKVKGLKADHQLQELQEDDVDMDGFSDGEEDDTEALSEVDMAKYNANLEGICMFVNEAGLPLLEGVGGPVLGMELENFAKQVKANEGAQATLREMIVTDYPELPNQFGPTIRFGLCLVAIAANTDQQNRRAKGLPPHPLLGGIVGPAGK